MMLPNAFGVKQKNTMVRLSWIKGLLSPFPYNKFIEEKGYSPIICDIYGKVHNIIEEDIQVIFTKSQFKMWKYYNDFDEYKTYFKQFNCTAGRCNIEEDRIKNAKINYQMLQTLIDINEDEIIDISTKSVNKIKNICQDRQHMMDALGITSYNTNMSTFQKAVKIYPPLLNDTYAKDIIRDIKNSLLKKYRSGKLEVFGKYTFVLPDFYAACEYWFGKIENPVGLLQDGEVYCTLFKNNERLDCLRSPHLFIEHSIRKNIAYKENGERIKEISKWFDTNGIYTSTHDLITKILQLDVDGDKLLVVTDKTIIDVAERTIKKYDIVPLYYNMRKALPTLITNENIYKGLNDAFVGGNIGVYSNDISKIWNNDVIVNGTNEQKQEAIDAVKLLCCENNFVIDYAKTLYKPTRPNDKNEMITKYTHNKLPAFFEFAKDKTKSQVEEKNNSLVNKLYNYIKDVPINTRKMDLGELDYTKMMSNVNITCPKEVSDIYNELNKQYRFMVNMKDEYIDNLRYLACQMREEFSKTGYTEETISDMLVYYLYKNKKRYKQVLWFCYGQYIVNNLKRNVKLKKTKFIQCIDCGEWVEVNIKDVKACRCTECQKIERRKKVRYNIKKYRNKDM